MVKKFKPFGLDVIASYTALPKALDPRPMPSDISWELNKEVVKHIDVAAARAELFKVVPAEFADGKAAAEKYTADAQMELQKALDGKSSIKKIEFGKEKPIYIPTPPLHEVIRPLLKADDPAGTPAQWVIEVEIKGYKIECWVCFRVRSGECKADSCEKGAA